MPNVGFWEILILVVVLLLVFGSRRVPEMGRSLGKGMREFKQAITGKDEEKGKSELTTPATAKND